MRVHCRSRGRDSRRPGRVKTRDGWPTRVEGEGAASRRLGGRAAVGRAPVSSAIVLWASRRSGSPLTIPLGGVAASWALEGGAARRAAVKCPLASPVGSRSLVYLAQADACHAAASTSASHSLLAMRRARAVVLRCCSGRPGASSRWRLLFLAGAVAAAGTGQERQADAASHGRTGARLRTGD